MQASLHLLSSSDLLANEMSYVCEFSNKISDSKDFSLKDFSYLRFIYLVSLRWSVQQCVCNGVVLKLAYSSFLPCPVPIVYVCIYRNNCRCKMFVVQLKFDC